MTKIKALMCSLGLAGLLLGGVSCGGSAAVKEMQAFADKMCKCKDMECATNVQKEMTEWASKMAKENPKGTKKDEEKIKKITEQLMKCTTDAMKGGAGKKEDK